MHQLFKFCKYYPDGLLRLKPVANNIIIIITIIIINIPGNHEVKELQKRAILVTAHILRKVLT
jgi:hypothetical protein